ncbi:MAG: DUF2330 domain-containing protein [Nannocystis sp.]|uniref:DUF2330 domain-containing protein n=1 Tax=Nannocystis sp. TaxID=1962667 RepID=UPI00242686F1|nr:DUF2330 domain-containing protein [Nannocystis sp.]MBK9756553.1 DUF2330 domain-containing protein [Nannocystis sp.]
MRTQLARLALPALIAALVLAPAAPAHACGGMLFPSHSERVGGMSEQELLVAFTPERTVLLASAGYKGATGGAPAFILPLAQEPTMVLQSELGVLAALDDLTAPEVHITVDDGDSGGGGLCGSAGGLKDGGGNLGGDRGDVMVLQRGETADYDWTLLAGDTGMSVAQWLDMSGYTLPADYAAALQPYLDAGDVVFAAKLKSDAATGALAPIELHLPPIEPGAFKIPYGLAAHSLPPGESLTITAYLIAAGGLAPGNYPAAAIDPAALIATSETETNYQELYDERVAGDGEPGWVIDASVADFSAASILDAYDLAAEADNLPTGTLRDGVEQFAARVPISDARITRLRSTLAAADLRDMTLTKIAGADVDRNLYAVYQTHHGQVLCGIDRAGAGSRGLPLAALLVPLLLLMRRRRR